MKLFALRVLFLLSVFFWLLSFTCSFGYPFPHDDQWSFYETKHFNIYFTPETKQAADRAYDLAEPIFDKVTSFFGYAPPDKVDLVLTHVGDFPNGYADFFNQLIAIQVAPIPTPMLGPFSEDTLDNLITHELTHIVQMNMNSTPPLAYSLLKRLSSKGYLYPHYILEGQAVYSEKLFSHGGRLYNSSFNEQMMAFAKYRHFPRLSQLTNPRMLQWPQGNGPYIVGAEFVDYLAKRYGHEKIIEVYHAFVDELSSVSFETAFQSVYGKPLRVVYTEFQDYVSLKYLALPKEESVAVRLVSGNGLLQYPHWRDETHLLYLSNEFDGDPSIRQLDISTGERTTLFSSPLMMGKFELEGDLLYTLRFFQKDLYRAETQLVAYSLSSRREEVVTGGVTDFDVANGVLFIVKALPTGNVLMRLQEGKAIPLLSAEYIGDICADASANRLAYVSRDHGKNALYWMNLQTRESHEVVKGAVRDIFFDGEDALLFVADHERVSQLFRYRFSSNSFEQLTRETTGVYQPEIRDGKLVYTTLSDSGYDLVLRSSVTGSSVLTSSLLVQVVPETIKQPLSVSKDVAPAWPKVIPLNQRVYTKDAKPYPIFKLNLLYFLPVIAFSTYGDYVGLATLLSDPLQYQQLAINFQNSYGVESFRTQYVNTAFYPFFSWSASKENKQESSQALLMFPAVFGGKLFQSVNIGMERSRSVSSDETYSLFSHSLSSYQRYPLSISPEKGFANQLVLKARVSDQLGSVVNALTVYVPGFSQGHVLKCELLGGSSRVETYSVGGFLNSISVRGYGFSDTKQGSSVGRASVEYRYPLSIVDDDVFAGYYIYRMYGAFFVDVADAGAAGDLFKTPLYSYGFALNTHGSFFTLSSLDIGLGLAHTSKSGLAVTFTVGMGL